MNDNFENILGQDYKRKIAMFYTLVSEMDTKYEETLKGLENHTDFSDFYLLKNHYILVGPHTNMNGVVFRFNDKSNLPEHIKNELQEAFDKSFL